MLERKLNKEEKQAELEKYRSLLLATIDYSFENKESHIKSADYDSIEYFNSLKILIDENFSKGRLIRLKQWFRDLTEMQLETRDYKFNKYLKDKTKYDIDIFKSYNKRINKLIEKGKITSDNQFYDISIMVDQLSQIEPIDKEKNWKVE